VVNVNPHHAPTYKNSTLPIKERVADLVSRMTLEEKVSQMVFDAPAIERLEIPRYWSPNINIFRDPRWGRGQETYGEDPYLTARMGVAFVKGLQGNDPRYLKVVATPKHFAVHSGPESNRHSFDAQVDERDLRETYLPHFEACVKEAGAYSIMGAYNRTNGEACCASPTLLQKILRDERPHLPLLPRRAIVPLWLWVELYYV